MTRSTVGTNESGEAGAGKAKVNVEGNTEEGGCDSPRRYHAITPSESWVGVGRSFPAVGLEREWRCRLFVGFSKPL